MSAATDRRQLWVEAREMLARWRENVQRPLDDEETFSAFVRAHIHTYSLRLWYAPLVAFLYY